MKSLHVWDQKKPLTFFSRIFNFNSRDQTSFCVPNRRLFVKRFRGLRTLGSWLKRSRLSERSVVLVCCLSKMVQYTVSNRLLYYQSWAHITIAINNNKHYKIIPMFCMAKKYGGDTSREETCCGKYCLKWQGSPNTHGPP